MLFGRQPLACKIPTAASNAFFFSDIKCFFISVQLTTKGQLGAIFPETLGSQSPPRGSRDPSHQPVDLGFKQHQSGFSVNMKPSHSLHNLYPRSTPQTHRASSPLSVKSRTSSKTRTLIINQ